MNLPNRVIRPEPHVYADYKDEKFEQNVQVQPKNQSLDRMISSSHGINVYITESVTYPETGGIYMKYKDVPYLRQGFVFPEALDAVNNLKRISVVFLSIVSGKGIRGRIGHFLANYVRTADWLFQWYDPNTQKTRQIYLSENRYRQSVRELIKLINNFLKYLEIKVIEFEGAGEKDFGRTIGTMIEFDNAYHWRMEDIFSETTRERLLANPRKEIKRLFKIYQEREKATMDFKVGAIVKVLNYALLIPSIKKAFKKAIESVDISKMGLTKDDRYFVMNYEGYEFEGKSIEERQKIWLDLTGGKPPERVFIKL